MIRSISAPFSSLQSVELAARHLGRRQGFSRPEVYRCSKTGAGLAGAAAAALLVVRPFCSRSRVAARAFVMPDGPKPVWDSAGSQAVHGSLGGSARLEKGRLHRVIWMCWTGSNPMPAHLQLCLQTVRRNSGVPLVVITPQNLAEYVTDPHPAYQYLHLAHRADYLRCYLLHHYGGIYLDCDTICLRSLAELFDLIESGHFDAVGYDGSQWGEFIGISDMGPFCPGSELTSLWFNALHGKLQERLPDIQSQQTDVFYWQEILRDIFLPVSMIHRQRITQALIAENPEKETLWSVKPWAEALGQSLRTNPHILILNNAKYGDELSVLSEEQILGGPAVLSQLLRQALTMPEP